MRRKLLNPNSMAVIMENFRRYVNENADEETTERIYLLREGKEPVETTLSTLMEKRDRGELNMVEMVDLMNESMQHEFKQIMAEHDQLILAEQEEELSEAEMHEIFGFGKKKKAAAAAAEAGAEGEEEDRHGLGASTKAAEEKGGGLKWKLRKKILTFMYSKVAAYIKGTFGQEKAAITPLQQQLVTGAKAAKSGNAKEAAKMLGMAAYKASLKGVKLLFKAMIKIIQGITWLVGKIARPLGAIFKHPVIRVIMIAFLCLAMVQAVGTTAIMYSGWKVANQVTALVTGKSATGHAVGAAAKGAVKGAKALGKKAVGLQEIDFDLAAELGGEETAGMMGIQGQAGGEGYIEYDGETMSWAEALGEVDATTLGAAIIKLASQMEDQEVLEYSTDKMLAYHNSAGEEIIYSEHTWASANVALSKEMEAISMMKSALRSIAANGVPAEGWGESKIFKETGEAMQGAIAAAKAACESDPAHCAGANELAKSIDTVWSGHVQSELFDASRALRKTGAVAEESWAQIMHSQGAQLMTRGVEGGAEAAEKLGAAGIQEKIT